MQARDMKERVSDGVVSPRPRIGIVSFGLGPIAVALATDFVFTDPASLKYSLALVSLIAGSLALLALMRQKGPNTPCARVHGLST